jgi:hypothetical protein
VRHLRYGLAGPALRGAERRVTTNPLPRRAPAGRTVERRPAGSGSRLSSAGERWPDWATYDRIATAFSWPRSFAFARRERED